MEIGELRCEMNLREKLMQLITEAKRTDPGDAPFSEYLVDFLIANGVTIETWIPVERLPDESCEVIIGKVDSDGNFYSVFGTSYSKKYQAFNVCDDFTDLEAEKVAIYPDFWKPMPAPIRKEVPSENP